MKYTNQLRYMLGIVAAVALGFGTGSVRANNLLGIDVSSAQGFITWPSVHADGVIFAFAKASEGTSMSDADFAGNMTRGKAAGMQMGAYHFVHPDVNCPSAEANHFWNVAGAYILKDGKSLSPAIDFEIFNGTVCQSSYTAWANAFNNAVKNKTTNSLNCQIIIAPCGGCNFTSSLTLGPWIINYNGQNLYTGSPWNVCCSCNVWDSTHKCGSSVWNYWGVSGTGAISGISGNVDLDAFNGTLSFLMSSQGIGGI
ncbi:MAG: glycoside hydrolase family 25 protein [Limisphaerales bacterium]